MQGAKSHPDRRMAYREWETRFAELKRFRQRFGHCRVPPNWPENAPFARWVLRQRSFPSRLPLAQVKRLFAIGFKFERVAHLWIARFLMLRRFARAHGHCRPPSRPNRSMLTWNVTQRQKRRAGLLDPWQIRWLDELGFDWDPVESAWEHRIQQLQTFHRRYGHCRVFRKKKPEWNALGLWLTQRRQKKEKIPARWRKALDDLGFEWQPCTPWETRLAELKRFRQAHGHCCVPWNKSSLSNWIEIQRQRRKQRRLTRRQIRELDAIGFDWAPFENCWQRRIEQLKAFRRRFGHCGVPQPRHPTEFTSLASWLSNVRFKKNRLAPHRRKALDELGVVWEFPRVAWQKRFEELKQFHRKYGHCSIPTSWPENPALARWVSVQRANRKSLSPAQVGQLNRLGFDWHPNATRWMARFKDLRRFRERHGHCRVSVRWQKDPRLGKWVAYVRRRKEVLSEEQRQSLDSLGFAWSHKRAVWDSHYEALGRFKRRFGHCEVPVAWSENRVLAAWVTRQRQFKHLLTKEQVEKLDQLGFAWRVKRLRNAKGIFRSRLTL